MVDPRGIPALVWDPAKAASNLHDHGVAFDAVRRLDWTTSLTGEDTRFDYGEQRFVTFAKIDGRVHVLISTFRDRALRVISLRKANPREVRDYERERQTEASRRLRREP